MKAIRFIVILASMLVVGCAASQSSKPVTMPSIDLIKIDTRFGVTQKFLLIKPENPVAAAVLLDGGTGKLNLSKFYGKPTIGKSKSGFLVRNSDFFAKQGLIVALMDAPSDMKEIGLYRANIKHAQDIKAVASYLKSETNVPVWLVGMSGGTFAAPIGAINIQDGIDGLVLFSSVTRCVEGCPEYPPYKNILDMDLKKITVPTLIVYHENDGCKETPPSDAPKIQKALVNSPKVEVKYFKGGKKPKSKPCGPLSAHGYYGIDKQVITEAASFIKSNSN
ncbi:MAG: hypothetical protein PVH42_04120 [Desulfobacterales bacterium]|jgi:dienelactone hydrolase